MDVAPICQRERQIKERQHEGGVKEKVRMTFWRIMECAIMLLAFKRLSKAYAHMPTFTVTWTHTDRDTHTLAPWIS